MTVRPKLLAALFAALFAAAKPLFMQRLCTLLAFSLLVFTLSATLDAHAAYRGQNLTLRAARLTLDHANADTELRASEYKVQLRQELEARRPTLNGAITTLSLSGIFAGVAVACLIGAMTVNTAAASAFGRTIFLGLGAVVFGVVAVVLLTFGIVGLVRGMNEQAEIDAKLDALAASNTATPTQTLGEMRVPSQSLASF